MDQGKDGEDEREGLVTYGDICSNRQAFSSLDQQVNIQQSHGFSELNRTQSGAIVSTNKSDIYRDQLTNVCQNVNSYIGNLEQQSSRLPIPPAGRAFGVNNVGLSDNSVSDLNNMCNNDINFNTNSTQDRTQCFSNLQNVAYYGNNISQPCVSNVSPLSNTVNSFHNINPYSNSAGLNKDWNTPNVAKYDSEKESSVGNSNKRRFLGASVGAPAPKIKRKRPPASELKSVHHQSISPNFQTPINDQKNSDTLMMSRVHSNFNNFPQGEDNSFKSSDGFSDMRENSNINTIASTTTATTTTTACIASENTFVPESNRFPEHISKLPENKYSVDNSKMESASEGYINCNLPLQGETSNLVTPSVVSSSEKFFSGESTSTCKSEHEDETKSNLNIEKSLPSDEHEQSSGSYVSDAVGTGDKENIFTLEDLVDGQRNKDINERENSDSTNQLHKSSNEEAGSLSQDKSDTNELATEIEKDDTNMLSQSETNKDIYDNYSREGCLSSENNTETQDRVSSDGNYVNFENLNSASMEDKDLGSDNPKESQETLCKEPFSNETENKANNLEETHTFHEESSISKDENIEKEADNLIGYSDVPTTDSKDLSEQNLCEETPNEAVNEVNTENLKLEVPSIKKEEDTNEHKESETKEKIKEEKMSSDEGDNNSDGEQMKPQIRRRPGASGLSAKPKVKNLRRNIREIISDDKLEENTLAAQKEEQLRLQRLQDKRIALREYMEQQQVSLMCKITKHLKLSFSNVCVLTTFLPFLLFFSFEIY